MLQAAKSAGVNARTVGAAVGLDLRMREGGAVVPRRFATGVALPCLPGRALCCACRLGSGTPISYSLAAHTAPRFKVR